MSPGRAWSAGSRSIGWTLPIDDTHFRIYVAGRVREKGQLRRMRSRQGGKLWEELSPEEHQRFPGDFEAQTGQGAITLHSDEHLAESDRGIALLRQFLRQQVDLVAKGRDPAGVTFRRTAPPRDVHRQPRAAGRRRIDGGMP